MHPPLDAEEGCLSHTPFYILLACERTQREGSRDGGGEMDALAGRPYILPSTREHFSSSG